MREAAQDRAFDLLDEIKDLGHKKKMAICELEDTLHDCFESSEDDEEEFPEDDTEMKMRYRKQSRYRRSQMRNAHDEDDEWEDARLRRRDMRMRRNRMGKY